MLLWTILELRENNQILELRENNRVLVVLTKLDFWPFGLENDLEGQFWPQIWNLWPLFPMLTWFSLLIGLTLVETVFNVCCEETHNYNTCIAGGKKGHYLLDVFVFFVAQPYYSKISTEIGKLFKHNQMLPHFVDWLEVTPFWHPSSYAVQKCDIFVDIISGNPQLLSISRLYGKFILLHKITIYFKI